MKQLAKMTSSAARRATMLTEPLLVRRFMAIDIALMFVYHFIFDLNYVGVVSFDFNRDFCDSGGPAIDYH
jgi:uncharacterized membrane protein